mgnify:CR=1 FL=1
MRLHGMQERDRAGFGVELIKRTILSHPPFEKDGWSEEWMTALEHLSKAQEILQRTKFYSDEFDPGLAAY